jgi:hypothetical protein
MKRAADPSALEWQAPHKPSAKESTMESGIKFFVPAARDAEEAETQYQYFMRQPSLYPPLRPGARVYALTFQHNGKPYRAQVGEPIPGWPDQVGIVLAIIESRQLVYVHTQIGVLRRTGPILAGHPDDCRDRLWFEDFPPPRRQRT